MDIRRQIKNLKIAIVIPTYNNQHTLATVIDAVLAYTDDVIVVNDGSTDGTLSILSTYTDRVKVISLIRNCGKGEALRVGMARAMSLGFCYAITIDSDGQHYASSIPAFVDEITAHPHSLIVGARRLVQEGMPRGNTFANKFSNFWFRLQTGIKLPDTQSGYRLYPLQELAKIPWLTARYEAELELLVCAAWRGVNLRAIPIEVYYAPVEERVSHFRPYYDFMRISVLNTILTFCAIVYQRPKLAIKKLCKR